MTGPLDGEMHHWFNGKIWTKNILGKRCHWKQIPDELESALNRFKPEGGSFVITCWGNIAALIQPKPLPRGKRTMVKTLRRGKAITSDKTKIYSDASDIFRQIQPGLESCT